MWGARRAASRRRSAARSTARDGGCRFPGCTHQRYVDAHHIEHWAEGGETKLSNLVTLCRLHHRLVHEGEIRIETPPGGGWRFVHPDGRHFEVIRCTRAACVRRARGAWSDTHAALGIHIDSDTAATRWRGERMDYELGVWVLCNQATTPDAPAPEASARTFPRKRPTRHRDRAAASDYPLVLAKALPWSVRLLRKHSSAARHGRFCIGSHSPTPIDPGAQFLSAPPGGGRQRQANLRLPPV